MNIESICIVGLGLMGGSLGLSLKKLYPDTTICGYDHNEKHKIDALNLKLVDKIINSKDDIMACDVIFLCIPVDAIIAINKELIGISKNSTIIDMGSTKEQISNEIPASIRVNLVASHPMTGTENSGPLAAINDLYGNKTVVLCDTEKSGIKQLQIAEEIFNKLNMNIVYMDSISHDKHAAFISHAPHAISFALANSVLNQEDHKSIIALAGGGFKDMSRIAQSSPAMWEAIFRQNRTNVLESIECFKNELTKCQDMIKEEKWEELKDWMGKANNLHDIL
jgi:prephenate dehydrogenase